MSPTTPDFELELPSVRCSKCGKSPPQGRERSMKRCSICMLVIYCSPKCQKTHNEYHAPVCFAGNEGRQGAAWGVSFADAAFDGRYGLKAKPCLSSPQVRGWVCPATELIGVPLYIAPEDNMDYTTKKDLESICHFLMMDPDTGFALDSWTSDPRHKETNYCAFHNGRHPLTPTTFETIVAFFRMIVDTVSGLSPTEGWLPMRSFLTPEAFQLFSRTYWLEQKRKGREGWEELLQPLA